MGMSFVYSNPFIGIEIQIRKFNSRKLLLAVFFKVFYSRQTKLR